MDSNSEKLIVKIDGSSSLILYLTTACAHYEHGNDKYYHVHHLFKRDGKDLIVTPLSDAPQWIQDEIKPKDNWISIETKPVDEAHILIYGDDQTSIGWYSLSTERFYDIAESDNYDGIEHHQVTHWQKIPAPPLNK